MSNVFRGDRVVVYDEHQQMRPGGDGYVHDFDRSALIIALAEDETVQARFLWNLPGDMRNRTLVVTMPLSEWRLLCCDGPRPMSTTPQYPVVSATVRQQYYCGPLDYSDDTDTADDEKADEIDLTSTVCIALPGLRLRVPALSLTSSPGAWSRMLQFPMRTRPMRPSPTSRTMRNRMRANCAFPLRSNKAIMRCVMRLFTVSI